MLVLESADAKAEARAWRAAGLGDFEPFHFERPARLPDGSFKKVAFTLAFAVHRDLPDAVFFACQQHAPEIFWRREYQRHDNGALGIEEAAMVAADPLALVRFRAEASIDGLFDEQGEVWDRNGRLLAQSRQLALLRRLGPRPRG